MDLIKRAIKEAVMWSNHCSANDDCSAIWKFWIRILRWVQHDGLADEAKLNMHRWFSSSWFFAQLEIGSMSKTKSFFFFFFFKWASFSIFHRDGGGIQPPEYGRWLWKSIRYADGVKIWIQPLRFLDSIMRWMWVLTTNFPMSILHSLDIVCGFDSI